MAKIAAQVMSGKSLKNLGITGVGATVTGEMHATTFHGDGSKLTGYGAVAG